MQNFSWYNPTRVVLGKGTIEGKLAGLVPAEARVMMTYGGGSIKQNGVYDKCKAALGQRLVCEFGGIEPNPKHETCMKAVELAKKNGITFVLAVGGGSVVDGTKYIVLAMGWTKTEDPYDMLLHWGFGYPMEPAYEPKAAVPFGSVLTLPATGSESNCGAVISHGARKLKQAVGHESAFPQFSILDPETTFSLPIKQVTNGIVDAYVHVLEQYLCHSNMGRLQDRQAEGIMCSLREIAPILLKDHTNYDAAADFMWCACQALNGLIAQGVRQCWAAHMVGHELTTFYGLDHGQTLAMTTPAVMRAEKLLRKDKYAQYADRVFGYKGADAADKAVELTEQFFKSLGVHTHMSEYGLTGVHFDEIAARFTHPIAAERNLRQPEVRKILDDLM
eukprot:TRINITY_DN1413_c0_g1_i1.p2 TRINITY_DN1413_c0_g1~~TRINITY_DN1413_c0_g1_i1.p2  ORF type:complete len:390 (-),score=145.31 TRINITY_DN1413_c0_g1_i1:634-1803(-)